MISSSAVDFLLEIYRFLQSVFSEESHNLAGNESHEWSALAVQQRQFITPGGGRERNRFGSGGGDFRRGGRRFGGGRGDFDRGGWFGGRGGDFGCGGNRRVVN